jgi:hypothetical protein
LDCHDLHSHSGFRAPATDNQRHLVGHTRRTCSVCCLAHGMGERRWTEKNLEVSSSLLPQLKYRLDGSPERSGELQGQHRRWNEHSVLDGVDGLSRHANQRRQLGLGEISARSFFA